jgi:hypothetical protein
VASAQFAFKEGKVRRRGQTKSKERNYHVTSLLPDGAGPQSYLRGGEKKSIISVARIAFLYVKAPNPDRH